MHFYLVMEHYYASTKLKILIFYYEIVDYKLGPLKESSNLPNILMLDVHQLCPTRTLNQDSGFLALDLLCVVFLVFLRFEIVA